MIKLTTYGGVYVFEDQESLDDYLKGEIVEMIKTHKNFENVSMRQFGVITRPSLIVGAKAKSTF